MKIKVLFTFIALWLCLGGVKVYAQTYIGTEAELRAFAAAVNNPDPDKAKTYEGEYIYLIADIPLGSSWTPIGTADRPFKGHFEGWGHKITNLAIDVEADNVGFFGIIDGGSVRDLGVEGDLGAEGNTIKGGKYVGGICGKFIAGEISSCYSSIAVSGTQYVGGLCGQSSGVIRNCWHEGNIAGSEAAGVHAGGLVGLASGTLQRCYVKNTRVNVKSANDNSYFGYIVGEWQGTPLNDNLDDCIFEEVTEPIPDFTYVKDVIVGSNKGDGSPSLKETIKIATTDQMNSTLPTWEKFWEGILNIADETSKNNMVWVIESGSYPRLNSFIKGADITFNFTDTKQWLTIVPNGNYNVPEDVKAYKVTSVGDATSVDGGTATLTRIYTLYEGCGALVNCTTAETKIATSINDKMTTSDQYSTWQTSNFLEGSPTSPDYIGNGEDPEYFPEVSPVYHTVVYTDYVLSNGTFVIAGPGPMARGKAFLRVPKGNVTTPPSPSPAKLRFIFQDEEETPTNIQSVDNGQLADDCWYTLDGRKLEGEPTEKGVYIVNGKKVMVQ